MASIVGKKQDGKTYYQPLAQPSPAAHPLSQPAPQPFAQPQPLAQPSPVAQPVSPSAPQAFAQAQPVAQPSLLTRRQHEADLELAYEPGTDSESQAPETLLATALEHPSPAAGMGISATAALMMSGMGLAQRRRRRLAQPRLVRVYGRWD